jgi:hypothetical protein
VPEHGRSVEAACGSEIVFFKLRGRPLKPMACPTSFV